LGPSARLAAIAAIPNSYRFFHHNIIVSLQTKLTKFCFLFYILPILKKDERLHCLTLSQKKRKKKKKKKKAAERKSNNIHQHP